MLRKLILAVAMIGAAQPAFAQFTMGPDAIGPIKRGWTISDILASGLTYEREVVPTEGDPVTVYRLKTGDGARIDIWFEFDGAPYSLVTYSSVFQTTEGARVGDTLATLQRLYPRGKVWKSLIEGASMSFLPFDVAPRERPALAFAFDPSGLSDDCMSDNKGCPDLSAMKSTSFAVTWLR